MRVVGSRSCLWDALKIPCDRPGGQRISWLFVCWHTCAIMSEPPRRPFQSAGSVDVAVPTATAGCLHPAGRVSAERQQQRSTMVEAARSSSPQPLAEQCGLPQHPSFAAMQGSEPGALVLQHRVWPLLRRTPSECLQCKPASPLDYYLAEHRF